MVTCVHFVRWRVRFSFTISLTPISRVPQTFRMFSCRYDSIAQMTIGIDCGFDLAVMTDFYAGSCSESVYVIASRILEEYSKGGHDWWHLRDGAWVMTDKGYRLSDYLRKFDRDNDQVKPTEMCGGMMAASESADSRRISQPRSASERMVWRFKQWDIFNGKPVVMSEWVFMQFYKDVIGWLITMQGPLSDKTPCALTEFILSPPL